MKVQNPIIGRARGSAGGMTFCKNYDKNVARAKAFEVSNPKTQAQQTQRAFFAELTALCSDFSDEQLRFLFPSKPKTMSRRNAISKQIAESYEIDGTTKSIDFADIDTLGNAPVMVIDVQDCLFNENKINIFLAREVTTNQSISDYNFVAAIVNETKGKISLTTEYGKVSDGFISADIPSGWEVTDSIHAIPLITNYQGAGGSTISFRTMSVAKRPARKGRNPHTGKVNN